MNKLTQIKPRVIEKALIKKGFIPRTGKGSPVVYTHLDH